MGVCGAEECTKDTFSKYEKLGYEYTIAPKKVEKSSTYDTVDSYYRAPPQVPEKTPVPVQAPTPVPVQAPTPVPVQAPAVPVGEKKSPSQLVKETPQSPTGKNKRILNHRDRFQQRRQENKKAAEEAEAALAKKKAEEEALLKKKEQEKLEQILKEKEDRLKRKQKKSEELKNRINKNLKRRN